MNILELIRSKYKTLSKVQKRIADYILEHPDEACFLSLKDFTKKVNTTEVTVINFTKKIGIKNYLELKQQLQAYIQNWLAPGDRTNHFSFAEDGSNRSLSSMLQNEREVLGDTYRLLQLDDLRKANRILHSAGRIFIAARGVSTAAASFMEQRLFYMGLDVIRLNIDDVRYLATVLNRLRPDDVFVLIAFPDYTREILSLASYLSAIHQTFISITDKYSSPLCNGSVVSFACSTDDKIFYNTLTAPVSIINLMASQYVIDYGESFLQYRDEVKELEKDLLKRQDDFMRYGTR